MYKLALPTDLCLEKLSLKIQRVKHISKVFAGTKSSFVLSENITQDMWHKYLFITVMSGVTTLMRAPIGPIRESEGGRDFIRNVFEESVQIMKVLGAQ